MNTIKFKNGTQLEHLSAFETSEFYDNAERRTITVDFSPQTVSFEELNNAATFENTKELEFSSDESSEVTKQLLEDYCIKISVKLHTQSEQEVLTLKLGKLTVIEKQLLALGLNYK